MATQMKATKLEIWINGILMQSYSRDVGNEIKEIEVVVDDDQRVTVK